MKWILGQSIVETLRASLPLYLTALALSVIGLITMHTFDGASDLSDRQIIWIVLGSALFFVLASLDLRILRRTSVILVLYGLSIALLLLLFLVAPIQGAQSWFSIGPLSFQPSDLLKIAFIALFAKYFSRRHMEINHISHVLLSGVYAGVPILLILLQPDLGTAVILSGVWFSLVLISGISKKYLAIIFAMALIVGGALWTFGLHEYQRARIVAFVNPASDIQGAGYNAYQAMVAVGSGEVTGKGIGYGTQSKLKFLPEYETDFIFASFAEEWGFVGVVLVLALYALLFFQMLTLAQRAATNFDAFFILGALVLLFMHVTIHAGINLGLLPVTGTTIPFMSYGGSHILMEFALLGIVASLAGNARTAPRQSLSEEYGG